MRPIPHRALTLSVPPKRDIALAAVICLLDFVLFSKASVAGSQPATIVFAVIGFAALAWRQSAPVPVFLILWIHLVAAALWFPDYRPTLGIWVALYTVAVIYEWRVSIIAMVATIVTVGSIAIGKEIAHNPEEATASAIFYVSMLYILIPLGVWGLGRWVRTSRQRLDSLDERRRREAAEAVKDERKRIARELHDIVSHSVSVMVLQAAGGRAVLHTAPDRAELALAQIEAVGKESMGELRRLLGVLDDSGAVGSAEDVGPQRGLADVPALVRAIRLSGLTVNLNVEGAPAQLAPSVDLSAYRIIQEALTNSLKHGGRDAIATVKVVWSSSLLTVEVTDDGGTTAARSATLSTSHGLPGLRERARAVGGSLEAGPDETGGFRVSATLPISPPITSDTRRTAAT